jgi:hypothetical protein
MKAEQRRSARRALSMGAPLVLTCLAVVRTAAAEPGEGAAVVRTAAAEPGEGAAAVTRMAAAEPGEGAAASSAKETASSEATPKSAKGLDLLFLETETGAAWVGLQTLHVKRDVVPTSTRSQDVGGIFGLSGGIKLLFLSIGPHARFGSFQDWDLWTFDLDVGFHAPLGALEPYFRLGGGYARLSRAFDKVRNGGSLRSDGYNLTMALGVDYFVTPYLTLGGRVGGEVIGLHRSGVNLDSQDGLVNDYLKYDGAAVGLALNGSLSLGLHL